MSKESPAPISLCHGLIANDRVVIVGKNCKTTKGMVGRVVHTYNTYIPVILEENGHTREYRRDSLIRVVG